MGPKEFKHVRKFPREFETMKSRQMYEEIIQNHSKPQVVPQTLWNSVGFVTIFTDSWMIFLAIYE